MQELGLTLEIIAVLGLLSLAVFLFVSEIVRVDVAGIIIMVLIGISAVIPGYSGLMDPKDLFSGFSSNAVISIIAVMIIGAGLDKTGVMGRLASLILKFAGRTEKRIMITISIVVAYISSFMQNIGAAALFLPVVNRVSRRTGIPVGRLLMPMGFCAILGGTVTMVGSSPLILLNDLLKNANAGLPENVPKMEPLGLFSVTPIGITLVGVGILYFLILGRRLLPVTQKSSGSSQSLQHFKDVYGIDGRMFEVEVQPNSRLIGNTLHDLNSYGRAGWILGVKTGNDLRIIPPSNMMVDEGSVLAIMGSKVAIEEYAATRGLKVRPVMREFSEPLSDTSAGIVEAVIPPDSKLIGQTIGQTNFRRRFGMRVLAVYRVDTIIDENLSELVFQAGDTVVAHAQWSDLVKVVDGNKDLAVVTDFPKESFRPDKLIYAGISFFIAINLVLFSSLPLSLSLMVGAVGMLISGVLNIDEAYRAVSWQTIFLLASLIPLGLVMDQTGSANWIASVVLQLMQGLPAWAVQLFLATLATAFTLVMSNVGATILLVPIAIKMAVGLDASPTMFALTVALAASNSFLIPTHQVNALIMGPAGYKVTDFVRVGGLMTAIILVMIVFMLNIFF
ncbi:MAG: SLC13 family permease [Arenicella sp.]